MDKTNRMTWDNGFHSSSQTNYSLPFDRVLTFDLEQKCEAYHNRIIGPGANIWGSAATIYPLITRTGPKR